MVGVWLLSVSVWVFAGSAGVGEEEAEELAKATGVRECARPAGDGEQNIGKPLRGDKTVLAEDRGPAGVEWCDGLTPANCLFLRGEAVVVSRCSSHNILGSVSLSLDKWPLCVHLDIRIKSRILFSFVRCLTS